MVPDFKYKDSDIEVLLEGILSGEIDEYNIPKKLYFAIADYMKEALYKGFGGTLIDFEGKDLELLTELRENIYMFSAAKSYQQIKDIGSLMFDGEGNRVSNKEFNILGQAAFENWNVNYGRTEYGTVVGQASMAVKWNEIEKNKDLLPILVFDTNGNPCEECAPFNGLAAPVDDPIWDWATPLLHFNCECVIRQEEKDFPITNNEDYDKVNDLKSEVPKEFQMNPGKDKVIFNEDNSYFNVPKKDINFAKQNFGLPILGIDEEIGKAAPITGLSLKEAEKVMQDFPVTESEKHAIKDYTKGNYAQINGFCDITRI